MFASLPAASLRLAVNRRRKVTLHWSGPLWADRGGLNI
jgi:hypothetical protein